MDINENYEAQENPVDETKNSKSAAADKSVTEVTDSAADRKKKPATKTPAKFSRKGKKASNEAARFNCENCEFVSNKRSELDRHHERLHLPLATPKKCQCGLSFVTKGEYHTHCVVFHPYITQPWYVPKPTRVRSHRGSPDELNALLEPSRPPTPRNPTPSRTSTRRRSSKPSTSSSTSEESSSLPSMSSSSSPATIAEPFSPPSRSSSISEESSSTTNGPASPLPICSSPAESPPSATTIVELSPPTPPTPGPTKPSSLRTAPTTCYLSMVTLRATPIRPLPIREDKKKGRKRGSKANQSRSRKHRLSSSSEEEPRKRYSKIDPFVWGLSYSRPSKSADSSAPKGSSNDEPRRKTRVKKVSADSTNSLPGEMQVPLKKRAYARPPGPLALPIKKRYRVDVSGELIGEEEKKMQIAWDIDERSGQLPMPSVHPERPIDMSVHI